MGLRMPESTDECLYFTRRELDNEGSVFAWVYKKDCPECGKAKMGKPVEGGKVKIRATEYVCPECGHTEEKKAHEESCMLDVVYKCPKCGNEGETTTPYVRKKVQLFNEETQKKKVADAFVVNCEKCNEKIVITKKMK